MSNFGNNKIQTIPLTAKLDSAVSFPRVVVLLHIQTDLGRENSASYYRQGRQLLLTLLTMVARWSRSTSNFYALIGQNLTGEFKWKIYAAS